MKTRKIGFGDEARRRIFLGTYALSAGYYDEYYGRAQKVRALMKDSFKKVFQDINVILSPTTATPAFKIGEKIKDPVEMYLTDAFTAAANLVGIPAISLPCGFVEDSGSKLPVGLQFMAPWFEEDKLFYLGKLLEKNAVS
jgi:aspartyl-tRNA(Asn)/glutamyl-tRNA(Gln) amidotransferase subunit A